MNKLLSDTISDLVADFLYYDRKEDQELPRGAIEDMVASGETSWDEIAAKFKEELISE